MATSMNAYDRLYSNMKTRFTVVNGNNEYSLGEYMLLKAGKKKESATLPATAATLKQLSPVRSFISYVNDKLMVKEAPAKDKVIRAFPFRTTAAAVISALLVCTFAVSYGLAGINSITDGNSSYISVTEDEEITSSTENNYEVK